MITPRLDPDPAMPRVLVEVAIDSVAAGLAAVSAGADRLELCRVLSAGGLSPDPEWVRQLKAEVGVPVFAMVRPRPGPFCFSPDELSCCRKEIRALHLAGADGVVTGVLTEAGRLDEPALRELIDVAGSLPVTFHRAFDELTDLIEGLERLIGLGVTRVLTSGGPGRALDGAEMIRELVDRAGDRSRLIAGGGVRGDHVARLVAMTGVSEVHLAGVRASGVEAMGEPAPEQVAAMVAALRSG
ncbi:MAG: copper homeostasis protein CutC [Gemmatimonadota bacterium]